jgi:hypothetical protein
MVTPMIQLQSMRESKNHTLSIIGVSLLSTGRFQMETDAAKAVHLPPRLQQWSISRPAPT